MKLNFTVAETARAMRRKNTREADILEYFGRKYTSEELTAQIEELRRQNRIAAKRHYWRCVQRRGAYRTEPEARPDAVTLAARDRRLSLMPVSLTAWLFGDPLPGQSALDRR